MIPTRRTVYVVQWKPWPYDEWGDYSSNHSYTRADDALDAMKRIKRNPNVPVRVVRRETTDTLIGGIYYGE